MSDGSLALQAAPKPEVRQTPENDIDLWEETDRAE